MFCFKPCLKQLKPDNLHQHCSLTEKNKLMTDKKLGDRRKCSHVCVKSELQYICSSWSNQFMQICSNNFAFVEDLNTARGEMRWVTVYSSTVSRNLRWENQILKQIVGLNVTAEKYEPELCPNWYYICIFNQQKFQLVLKRKLPLAFHTLHFNKSTAYCTLFICRQTITGIQQAIAIAWTSKYLIRPLTLIYDLEVGVMKITQHA